MTLLAQHTSNVHTKDEMKTLLYFTIFSTHVESAAAALEKNAPLFRYTENCENKKQKKKSEK